MKIKNVRIELHVLVTSKLSSTLYALTLPTLWLSWGNKTISELSKLKNPNNVNLLLMVNWCYLLYI